MHTDHPTTGGDRVNFIAHDAIVAALDRLAAENGETRSHTARRIIAGYLQAAELLPASQPMTPRAGRRRART